MKQKYLAISALQQKIMDNQHYFHNCMSVDHIKSHKESTNHYKKSTMLHINCWLMSVFVFFKVLGFDNMSTNDNAKHVHCHDPIGEYFVFKSTQRKKKNIKCKRMAYIRKWIITANLTKKIRLLLFNISNILLFEICIGLKQEEASQMRLTSVQHSNKYVNSKIPREKMQTLLCLFSYDYHYFVPFSLNCDKILDYLFVLVIANFKEEFEHKKLVSQ
ncbi:hypothetical protein RFI_03137 [Reticulomyxa filosa]|uniref:Uncharacterized protein n=1 Tax=Reticulomyxa filosa TaxID=46433 RepID=X6P765_RETFI|nr:hypothetical protein RFI_03137 [Reticulomyxa filosa]|eukprot:ETO33958.1 hypothetical protein RFI_03137 [Reticulomyxa filosa]